MAVNSALGIEQFAADIIHDEELRKLMTKIQVIRDAEIERIHQEDADKLASKVEIICRNGQVLTRQVDFPKGDPDNPVSWEEAKAKFMHLAVPVYGQQSAGKLCELIEHIENCDDFAQSLAECWKEG